MTYPYTSPYGNNQQSVNNLYTARSKTFDDGSMLLDPGESVPAGFTVAKEFPNGKVAVVPANQTPTQQPTTGGSPSRGQSLGQAAGNTAASTALSYGIKTGMDAALGSGATATGTGTGVATGTGAGVATGTGTGVATGTGTGVATGTGAGTGAATGASSGLGGAGATAGAALAAAIIAQNMYETGGRQVLSGKAKSKDWINNVVNVVFPWLNPIVKLGGKSIGGMLTGGKSTKDYQKERRAKLLNAGVTGLDQFDQISKKDAGKVERDPGREGEWTPWDYASSLGNYETFGNDWDKLSLDEKVKVVQAIQDANLYDADQGDVLIRDKDRARQIGADVLAGKLGVKIGSTNPYRQVTEKAESTDTIPRAASKGWDPKSSPSSKPGYNSLSRAEKDKLWDAHKKAMSK